MQASRIKILLVLIASSTLLGCNADAFLVKPQDHAGALHGPQSDDAKTEPKQDAPDEPTVPPQNISGSYLIGCEASASDALEPNEIKLSCQVEREDRSSAAASGTWGAQLIASLPGESIEVLDATQGVYLFRFSSKDSVSSLLHRTLLQFVGKADGHSLSAQAKAHETLRGGDARIEELTQAWPRGPEAVMIQSPTPAAASELKPASSTPTAQPEDCP